MLLSAFLVARLASSDATVVINGTEFLSIVRSREAWSLNTTVQLPAWLSLQGLPYDSSNDTIWEGELRVEGLSTR